MVWLAAAGCSGDPDEVGGKMVDTHLTEAEDTPQPWTAEDLTLTAMVLQRDGNFLSYPGRIEADGSFRVPGVPDGLFYL